MSNSPSLLPSGVQQDWDIVQEEVFGPVVTIQVCLPACAPVCALVCMCLFDYAEAIWCFVRMCFSIPKLSNAVVFTC